MTAPRPDRPKTLYARRAVLMLVDNPCDPDPRVSREAEALSEAGYTVTIVAWRRNSDAGDEMTATGVHIVRCGPCSQRRLGWRQAFWLAGFYWRAFRKVTQIETDLIVAHDFLMLPLGVLIAWWRGVPLAYDAHEIYTVMEAGRLPRWYLWGAARLEAFLVDRAVRVFVTVSQQRWDEYWDGTLKRRDYHIVGNWYDPPAPARRGQNWETGIAGSPVLGYAGTLAPSRRVDLLIALARKRPDVGVLVAGRGDPNIESELRAAAEELDNLVYVGWTNDAIGLLLTCDAVYYVIDPSHPYYAFAAPNTLYIAMAIDRPLIARGGGEVAWVMGRSDGVLALSSLTADAVSQAVDRVAQWLGWGPLRDRYTWQEAAKRYVQSIDGAMGERLGGHGSGSRVRNNGP